VTNTNHVDILQRFEALFYGTAFFPLTLAVFDLWGRLAETGSGNKSPLVALECSAGTTWRYVDIL